MKHRHFTEQNKSILLPLILLLAYICRCIYLKCTQYNLGSYELRTLINNAILFNQETFKTYTEMENITS